MKTVKLDTPPPQEDMKSELLKVSAPEAQTATLKEMPDQGGWQKTFAFPNGYGASVVTHKFSYGLELALLDEGKNIIQHPEITEDVEGYLNSDTANDLLNRISKLEGHRETNPSEKPSPGIKKVQLGVSTKSTSKRFTGYFHTRINEMVENSIDSFGEEFRDRYQAFADQLTDAKVKHKELMVDDDILKCFIQDCDSRACLDYREGYLDDDPYAQDEIAGGKWIDRLYWKLVAVHPQYRVKETVSTWQGNKLVSLSYK